MDEQKKQFSLEDIQNSDEKTLVDNASEMWRIVKKTASEINGMNQAMKAQAAQIKANLDAYQQARKDQDKIALYLGEHYADEIKRGKHNGMTFAEVIIMYLSRERDLNKPLASRPQTGGVQ